MTGVGVSKGLDSLWREFERQLHLNGTRHSSTHGRQWVQKEKHALRLWAVKSSWYSDFWCDWCHWDKSKIMAEMDKGISILSRSRDFLLCRWTPQRSACYQHRSLGVELGGSHTQCPSNTPISRYPLYSVEIGTSLLTLLNPPCQG